jgi:hypothetical protein
MLHPPPSYPHPPPSYPRTRVSSTPRVLGSIASLSDYWMPACAGMTGGYAFAFSRRHAPEFCKFVRPKTEGAGRPLRKGAGDPKRDAGDPKRDAGKTGCALHPRSRVQRQKEKRTRAYRFSGSSPAFPAQWFYGLFRALLGDRAFLSPSPPRSLLLKNLMPASRHQDHTTSPSASAALVSRSSHVHRIPPRVRDDREPPLMWDGTE